MVSRFSVVDVAEWTVAGAEPAGLDEKQWLEEPSADAQWLFKPVVARHGRRQGEDWSEKVASECAALFGVPAARIELATRRGQAGCLSRSVRPEGWDAQPGSVLLGEVVRGYDRESRDRTGHPLENIAQVLDGFGPPPSFAGPSEFTAFDVFAGFLMFDAWIANQDRHSDNWSVLVDRTGVRRLMASYDHASSLGFNLTDAARERILSGQPGIEHWVSRGRAQRFERGQDLALVDHAADALGRAAADVRGYWKARLTAVDQSAIRDVVAAVPEMSEATRTFCVDLLEVNRRRLLDVC